MITYLETSYTLEQVNILTNDKDYKREAKKYEDSACHVFKMVKQCSNNITKINNMLDDFLLEDYYRIKTYDVKYPTTLLSYAAGIAAPKLIEELTNRYYMLMDITGYKESLFKQLIYNVINNNKYAILKIKELLMDDFDITYVDNDNGLNILEVAIIYNSKLLELLLTFPRLTPYDTDKILILALNSDNINDTDRYANVMLLLLKNLGSSSKFMEEYFTKKIQDTGFMMGSAFEEIEDYLLVKGINAYYEYCENPIKMAKQWSEKLEHLETFMPLMDKFIVNIILNPSLAIQEFTNFVKKLHKETHLECVNNDEEEEEEEEEQEEQEDDEEGDEGCSDEICIVINREEIWNDDPWSWPNASDPEDRECEWSCDWDIEACCFK